VPLPVGADPADLVQREGPTAIAERIDGSVPFVRFRVERTLALGDLSSAEGKDAVIDELKPAFAAMSASVLKEELLQLAAQRLAISEDLARQLLDRGRRGGAPAPRSASRVDAAPTRRPNDRQTQLERGFLVLSIALPESGAKHLDEITDEHFTDPVNARAAVWLRNHLDAPTKGLPEADAELDQLVRRLADLAARSQSKMAALEVERLQLELALLERQMATAGPGTKADQAKKRIELRARLDDWLDRSLG
jgi:DNA primase